jgi:hypothetical protein
VLATAGEGGGGLLSRDELVASVRTAFDAAWHPAGFTAPNPVRYPWQWLWDSCFHALIWAELGDDRGLIEIGRLLDHRDADGFVPHVIYAPLPNPHEHFWGRPGTSSITQPPMYGHALAELARRGIAVGDQLLGAATHALWFLLDVRRRHASGLIELCHPWESGADDSPRWDHWYGTPWDRPTVARVKGELLAAVERSAGGAPIANPAFDAGPASFSALVAFNARELAGLTGDDRLRAAADELAERLDDRWDATRRTWVDAGPSATGSARVRTLDALMGALTSPDPVKVDAALNELIDPLGFGGRCGPTGVHRAEPVFEPRSYWRGSAWPQLNYLAWVAANRAGRDETAATLAAASLEGASRSGLAEHWDPDDGTALGAVPQSWTGLVLVMTSGRHPDR